MQMSLLSSRFGSRDFVYGRSPSVLGNSEHPSISQAQVVAVLGGSVGSLGAELGREGGRDGSQRPGVCSRVQNDSDRG